MNYTYQIFEKIFIPKLVILFRLFTIVIMNKISIFEIKKIFNISILLFVILKISIELLTTPVLVD